MKPTVDQAIIDLLNDLMTKDRDAVEGYTKASSNLSDLDLKEMMIRFAKQRKGFISSLKDEIADLGGTFEDSSSLTSTVHRIWMDIIGTFSTNNSDTILKECLRGEEQSLKDYKLAASNEYLPKSTKKLIENHQVKIEKAIEELKDNIDDSDNSIPPLPNIRTPLTVQ